MVSLSTLGFDSFFQAQYEAWQAAPAIPARIVAEHRGAYDVMSELGSGQAQLSGRLRLELQETSLPGVGDWVLLKNPPDKDRLAIIERLFNRRTIFERGAAGREGRTQVIAANVDQVLIVCGLDHDYNVRRIERYLARVWASGAQPTVILNKADLCADVALRQAEVERHSPGVAVLVTDALNGVGLAPVRALLTEGVTGAMVGSSGAGKSTLVNVLFGAALLPTGAVRTSDERGRHTTSHRQLVVLPQGGLVLDTPGMRELQLCDDAGLENVFEEICSLANQCRFGDCQHASEPGCAVQAALASGELAAERFEHFQKLQREARAFERRQNVHLQRQSERVWSAMHDEVARLRRFKGQT